MSGTIGRFRPERGRCFGPSSGETMPAISRADHLGPWHVGYHPGFSFGSLPSEASPAVSGFGGFLLSSPPLGRLRPVGRMNAPDLWQHPMAGGVKPAHPCVLNDLRPHNGDGDHFAGRSRG